MRGLLLVIVGALAATPALAEDWSGGYFGLSAGGFKGRSTWSTTQLGPDNAVICPGGCLSDTEARFSDATGGTAGVHLGYNWLLGGHLLLGLETGTGTTNSRGSINHTPGFFDVGSTDDITATYEYNGGVIGRVGLVAGPVLLYGLAGPWWQKVSVRYNCTGGTNSWCLTPHSENKADALRGWVAGGGLEYRFASRVSTRLDYRYAKYEDKDYTFFSSSASETVFARTGAKTYILSLGLSYRF
jgi:opacity protein-like surface antigen